MIHQVQIKNFKAWRDTGLVACKPLTLLFGTNSSGKSSIEQFFLLLRQTVESSDLQAADSKWIEWKARLLTHGIRVEFLCSAELAKIHARKTGAR